MATYLASKLRVKLWPGLSARMRMSMIALYWTWFGVLAGVDRYLRMRLAASFAAAGLDSALSTIWGRWTNSLPCWWGILVSGYLGCHCVFTYRGPGASTFAEGGLYAQLAESDAIRNMQTHHLSQENAFGRVLRMVRGAFAGVCGGQPCLRDVSEGKTHWVA